MARYNGFDYESNEQVARTRREWREWIEEMRHRGCYVTTDVGETFIRKRRLGSHSTLIMEVYATPSQLGIRVDGATADAAN